MESKIIITAKIIVSLVTFNPFNVMLAQKDMSCQSVVNVLMKILFPIASYMDSEIFVLSVNQLLD